MCAISWCGLELTFDLAAVILISEILSWPLSCKLYGFENLVGTLAGDVRVLCNGVTSM